MHGIAAGLDVSLMSAVLAAIVAVIRDVPTIFQHSYCVDPDLLMRLLRVLCLQVTNKKFIDIAPVSNSSGSSGEKQSVMQTLLKAINKVIISGKFKSLFRHNFNFIVIYSF